jgi:transposase
MYGKNQDVTGQHCKFLNYKYIEDLTNEEVPLTPKTPLSRKQQSLKEQGTLNPCPEEVTDSLFQQSDFFDSEDIVQVKYEMLRRVEVDKDSVSHSAATFGFSRPTYYQTQAEFQRGGVFGLVPRKRGPRHPHKLTSEVLEFLLQQREEEPRPTWMELARRVQERFELNIHAGTIARALKGKEKKRRRRVARR